MFEFAQDHSLLTVPKGWVRSVKTSSETTGTEKLKTKCFYPIEGSEEESRVRKLTSMCSDPDLNNWKLLDGVVKGIFSSQREAEAYITDKLGTLSSGTVTDIDKANLDSLEKKSALAVKRKSSEKKSEKNCRPSPRTVSIMTRSPAPNVPRTPTSMSQRRHNPSPNSTSNNISGMHHTVLKLIYIFSFSLLNCVLPHVQYHIIALYTIKSVKIFENTTVNI